MISPEVRLQVPSINYQDVLDYCGPLQSEADWDEFRGCLQYEWFDLYNQRLDLLGYPNDGLQEGYEWGTFTYCHDTSAFGEFTGEEWWRGHRSDPRIVAVHGFSASTRIPRDNSRISYHDDSLVYEFGATEGEFAWDKGHFIAHTIGGHVDNGLFAQVRDINRGWGNDPKLKAYRAMETYARDHPGTFVFSRPIYGDGTEHPFFVEYGLLKEGREWWVEVFPNRYRFEPFNGFESAPAWRRKYLKNE